MCKNHGILRGDCNEGVVSVSQEIMARNLQRDRPLRRDFFLPRQLQGSDADGVGGEDINGVLIGPCLLSSAGRCPTIDCPTRASHCESRLPAATTVTCQAFGQSWHHSFTPVDTSRPAP